MILVAAVGKGDYKEVEYFLESQPERSCRTSYGPVATARLAGDIREALVLLTPEAEARHWAPLSGELDGLFIRARKLPIPLGRNEREMWEVVAAIDNAVDANAELVVDITPALRHLPLLMLASLAYLTAERHVMIRGIYYGAFEAREGDRAPIFDLSPFLTLTNCYHAVRQFRETGDARRLADYLKELNAILWNRQVKSNECSLLVSALSRLSASLVAPLPIEAGIHARQALRHLEPGACHIQAHSAAGHSLVNAIRPTLEEMAVDPATHQKKDLTLSLGELHRQLRAIRFAARSQAYDRALLLLREWVVSRCLLADGKTLSWLDYSKVRKRAEQALNSLSERTKTGIALSPDSQKILASLWDRIAARRNKLAHAGMNEDVDIKPEAEAAIIHALIKECEKRCDDDINWHSGIPDTRGELLITPLGFSPGVLYSALLTLRPDEVIVVTSNEAAVHIPLISGIAEFPVSAIHRQVVADAHSCFSEKGSMLAAVRRRVLAADRITINVTGGTTALQYLVETIGRVAERMGAAVRRVALLDRRPAAEQNENPYVCGELVLLDSE
jgi:hypothetical protein